ncbi:sulfite exporter TauE/SafE family protein [Reyranella sp. CPCC 100927]|uniref:sulfite exporter TauE/SafE family protein n=1 Tax=Reyranella sp. CPCC 100927 TaxID=2599616 RepID=UPI0011B76B76|nr:sulfite exporter TauE/SafE family protein [Reyranella sp. CPCC 100927]TWT05756.1 sulfite exporter TauE/SafE family protein [Reyranella sp. CPCC 100927]
MSDLSTLFVVTALVFLLAGFVKGVIGLGLPTVAMGLLGAVMAPAQAAALLIIPSFVTNVWQLLAGPRLRPLVRRLWTMMAGVCVGTWAGAGLLTADTTGRAAVALGVALVLYALVGLAAIRFRVPANAEPWLSPLVGAATGLVTGATGVFVIPAVPYLQALDLDKEELIQALGLSFTVSTLALAAGLLRDGVLAPSIAGTSLLALAPSLVGMFVGQYLRQRVQPQTFRRWFMIGLLALGAYLAVRPWL